MDRRPKVKHQDFCPRIRGWRPVSQTITTGATSTSSLTLKRVNAGFVSEEFARREADVIWKLAFQGRPIYLFDTFVPQLAYYPILVNEIPEATLDELMAILSDEAPVSPTTLPGIAALIRYLLVNLHEISGVEKGSWIRQPPFRAVRGHNE